MNTSIFFFAFYGTAMLISMFITIVWMAAVHDGKIRLQRLKTARMTFKWQLYLQRERVNVRDQTLAWASGEFHDNIAQVLSVTRASMVRNLMHKSRRQIVRDTLLHADIIRDCVEDVRLLSHSFDESFVARVGLKKALESRVSYIGAAYGLDGFFSYPETEPELSLEEAHVLYRIVQECLHNTVRHARASRVSVRVSCSGGDRLVLEITDNGVGIGPGMVIPATGMGLSSIRERVRSMGGTLDIVTGHGQGLTILITLKSSHEKV